MTKKHETREAWLTTAAEMLRAYFGSRFARMHPRSQRIAFPETGTCPEGEPMHLPPTNLRVSCSNPSNGIRNRVRGECVFPEHSADQTWEIWISPRVDDAQTVLLVLLHELAHATLERWERGAGHGSRFFHLASALGLARPMTSATIADGPKGARLRLELSNIASELGDYPHAGVDFAAHDAARPRQSTRMMKAECLTDGCGFKVRITRTWAAQATPLCPCCEGLGIHSRTVVRLDSDTSIEMRLVPPQFPGDTYDLCQLAGVTVSPTGEDDAAAVERAAVLRAEREEAARLAREAAEEAARVARRDETARAAAAAARPARRRRTIELGEAADLGPVEGQGVQNRYGASEARRDARAAERAARPVPAFEGVDAGTDTIRHLMSLAMPGCLDEGSGADLNEVEDAVRAFCDRQALRPPGRFTLAEAWRASQVVTPEPSPTPEPAPMRPPSTRHAARFARIEFD